MYSERKIKDCEILVNKYYPVLRYADKKGQPPKSHLKVFRAKKK